MKLSQKIFSYLLFSLTLISLFLFTLINPNKVNAQTCGSIFDCCTARDPHGNCTNFSGAFFCSGADENQCTTTNPKFVCESNGWTVGNNGCRWITPTPPPPTPTSPPPPPGVTPTPTPLPPPVTGNARPRYTPALPYPFPCDKVAPEDSQVFDDIPPEPDIEFHSLRPYQASPCNLGYEDLALSCGNDLIISDQVNINKNFFPYFAGWTYTFEDEQIDPVPPEYPLLERACRWCDAGICRSREGIEPCIPDINQCDLSEDCANLSNCVDNGDGTETCTFEIDRVRDIAIDLEGAYLPIMGFTEPSVGSFDRPDRVVNRYDNDETMSDAEKVNEYVSWYAHGLLGRAEYDPPNPDTEEGHSKIVDFSGPLRRLLAFVTQDEIREDQENAAGDSRHNQETVCISATGQPTACPGAFAQRITNTSGAHREYIPFSSTEDRYGRASFGTYSIQPALSSTFRILTSAILNQIPAVLHFAHMEEGSELGQILQRLYAYDEAELEAEPEDWVASTSKFCDLRGIRSNPGDNLFAGEMSATVTYTAQVDCEFAVYDPERYPGNLCERLGEEVGEATRCVNPSGGLECSRDYGQVDCPSGSVCAPLFACQPPPTGTQCDDFNLPDLPPFECVPSTYTCQYDGSPDWCPGDNWVCGANCTPPPSEQINLVQTCENPVQIAFRVSTETPLADDVWKRLVANPVSVFRRIFPQIEDDEGRPITRLFDMPAATAVLYQGEGVQVAGDPSFRRSANEGELYFPHIGGVHEYFLKCIQKTLRPEGFGEGCISGPEPLAGLGTGECVPAGGTGTGQCQLGVGFCSPSYLSRWFSGCRARQASIICNGESGGNPSALNCSCLNCNPTCGTDYSVGLFQINLLAHCASSSFDWDWGRACTVLDQSKVDECLERFFDPEQNAEYAAQISNGGRNWSPWSVYTVTCQSEVDKQC